MFLAITRKIDRDGAPTNEISKVFVETNSENVARNIANDAAVEYYYVTLTALNAELKKCSIKTGTRISAPAREIVEVEADGSVVASVEKVV